MGKKTGATSSVFGAEQESRLTAGERDGGRPLCDAELGTANRGDVPRRTLFHVGKQPTVWGEVRPSHYKPLAEKVCSRPGCNKRRRKSGRYCLYCHALYARMQRKAAR